MAACPPSDAACFNTLTNQISASQDFATAILAPSVLGWLGQVALWGMVVGWSGTYMRSDLFKRDSRRMRLLLLWAVGVCTMQAAFNMYLIIHWSCTQGRGAEIILAPSQINALQPLSCLLVGVPVQLLLASRACALLRSRWVKRACYVGFGILIVVEAAFTILNFTLNQFFHENRLSPESTLFKLVAYSVASGVWLGASATVDIAITVTLCVVLRKRIAGFNSDTDSRLIALLWLGVQSASYTSFCALGGAIASYATPRNDLRYTSIAFPFWYLLPSCYVLSLLTSLCSRLIFDKKGSSDITRRSVAIPAIRLGADGDLLTAPLTPRRFGFRAPSPVHRGSGASPSPHRAVREKQRQRMEQYGGGGIQVREEVSVVVDEGDDYDAWNGRPRSRIPVGALEMAGRREEVDLEKGGKEAASGSESGEER